MMDTMNDLLICAKAVGYKIVNHGPPDLYGYHPITQELQLYNPRTNDAQAMELLKKRGLCLWEHQNLWHCVPYIEAITEFDRDYAGYETPNEAIIKAVVAIEESK